MQPLKLTTILLGLLFIVIGVGFMLEQFGILPFSRLWDVLWPSLFILLGIYVLFINWRAVFPATVFAYIGVAGLLDTFNVTDDPWRLWPILLISLGISIMLGFDWNSMTNNSNIADDTLNDVVMFWGIDRKVTSQAFKGGTMTIMFGGGKVNLRDAKLAENQAKLNITTMFGGLEIIVPPTMRVANKTVGIFGGSDDKTKMPPEPNAPVIEISGVTMFGGLSIKNRDEHES
jgi:hypothetical protein